MWCTLLYSQLSLLLSDKLVVIDGLWIWWIMDFLTIAKENALASRFIYFHRRGYRYEDLSLFSIERGEVLGLVWWDMRYMSHHVHVPSIIEWLCEQHNALFEVIALWFWLNSNGKFRRGYPKCPSQPPRNNCFCLVFRLSNFNVRVFLTMLPSCIELAVSHILILAWRALGRQINLCVC